MFDKIRYMIVVLGRNKNLHEALKEISDDRGIYFIEGEDLFMGTFYSDFTISEIHEALSDLPAMMVFDISVPELYGVNLPYKYYSTLFPEVLDIGVTEDNSELEPKVIKKKAKMEKAKIKSCSSIDEVLDKLSKNNYDRSCLSESDIEILNKI